MAGEARGVFDHGVHKLEFLHAIACDAWFWIGWWRPPHIRGEINSFVMFMTGVGAMLVRAVDWFRFGVNNECTPCFWDQGTALVRYRVSGPCQVKILDFKLPRQVSPWRLCGSR